MRRCAKLRLAAVGAALYGIASVLPRRHPAVDRKSLRGEALPPPATKVRVHARDAPTAHPAQRPVRRAHPGRSMRRKRTRESGPSDALQERTTRHAARSYAPHRPEDTVLHRAIPPAPNGTLTPPPSRPHDGAGNPLDFPAIWAAFPHSAVQSPSQAST